MPEDVAEAVRLFRKSAEQGYALAQYNLGLMHSGRKGLPQDFIETYAWLTLAAEAGVEDAQKIIEIMNAELDADDLAKGRARSAELSAMTTQVN